MPNYDVYIRRTATVGDTTRTNVMVPVNDTPITATDPDAAIAQAASTYNVEGRYFAYDRAGREVREVTFRRNPIVSPVGTTPGSGQGVGL